MQQFERARVGTDQKGKGSAEVFREQNNCLVAAAISICALPHWEFGATRRSCAGDLCARFGARGSMAAQRAFGRLDAISIGSPPNLFARFRSNQRLSDVAARGIEAHQEDGCAGVAARQHQSDGVASLAMPCPPSPPVDHARSETRQLGA
jgi:hypothetical protein